MEAPAPALATRLADHAALALCGAKHFDLVGVAKSQVLTKALPLVPQTLLPFETGRLGNFPFEWQNQTNLQFSAETYGWISASVSVSNGVVRQAGPFTNLYISAMRQVQFTLSATDRNKMSAAAAALRSAQVALLQAWKAAYGTLPTTGSPVDGIISDITSNWASPPTTFQALRVAPELTTLLNKLPPAGGPILPVLATYLAALTEDNVLVNLGPANTGLAAAALSAVMTPAAGNGGVELDDGSWQPAFDIATPPDQIRNNLESGTGGTGYIFDATLNWNATSGLLLAEGIHGKPTRVDPSSISLDAGGKDLISEIFTVNSTAINAEIDFTDLTIVHFGPRDFNVNTRTGWFWPRPLRDALANTGEDVTGFSFGSQSSLGFLTDGSFGLLTGVAISRHPSVRLRQSSPAFETVASTLSNLGTVDVSVNGQNFEATPKVTSDAAATETVLTLTPIAHPPQTGDRAFVHAVQAFFPLSSNGS